MELIYKGRKILIDEEDLPLLLEENWNYNTKGYLYQPRNNYTFFHRKIMRCPENKIIDHKNRKKYDYRKKNLRITSHSINTQNCSAQSKCHFKGVSYSKSNKGYVSQINKEGIKVYLGTYNNPYIAAIIYDKAAIYLYGPDAYINLCDLREAYIQECERMQEWKFKS
jgi:hypothetical protein